MPTDYNPPRSRSTRVSDLPTFAELEGELPGGEVRTVSSTGAEKGVKPERFDLIPSAALQEVARVYGAGATKYDDTNYLRGSEYRKMLASLLRHVAAWEQGFDNDGDELPAAERERALASGQATGLHHLAHAVFHCLTLITYQRYELGVDDRIGRQLEAGESFQAGPDDSVCQ